MPVKDFDKWAAQGVGLLKADQPGHAQRLVALVLSKSPRIAEAAARNLPWSTNKKADPAIVAAMEAAYGRCASPRARQTLLEHLRDDTPSGVQLCRTACRDSDPAVRLSAFMFLNSYYGRLRAPAEAAGAQAGLEFLRATLSAETDPKNQAQMQQAIVTTEKRLSR